MLKLAGSWGAGDSAPAGTVSETSLIFGAEGALRKKVDERVDLLTGLGKVMIGSKVAPLDPPYEDYRYYAELYFYQ